MPVEMRVFIAVVMIQNRQTWLQFGLKLYRLSSKKYPLQFCLLYLSKVYKLLNEIVHNCYHLHTLHITVNRAGLSNVQCERCARAHGPHHIGVPTTRQM